MDIKSADNFNPYEVITDRLTDDIFDRTVTITLGASAARVQIAAPSMSVTATAPRVTVLYTTPGLNIRLAAPSVVSTSD